MFNKPQILTFEEFKEATTLPKTTDENNQRLEIEKNISKAENMIDNYCGGKVFWNYEKIKNENTDESNFKIFKLKRAVIEATKIINITGDIWVDLNQAINSNVSTSIQTTSQVSNFEFTRQDIISNLVAGGWYDRLSFSKNLANGCEDIEETKLLELIEKVVRNYPFLRTDGQNAFLGQSGPLNMSASNIEKTGDIISNYKQEGENKRLIGFDLVDGNASNSTKAEKADEIFDPVEGVYKLINEFDIHYFDGLNKQEIYEAIAASDKIISNDLTYVKGWIGIGLKQTAKKEEFAWYESLIDENIGNTPPNLHPEAWKELPISAIDKSLIEQVVNEILAAKETGNIDVEFLDEVKQFENQQDFENYKQATGTTDADFEDVIVPPAGATPEQVAQIEENKNNIEQNKNDIEEIKNYAENIEYNEGQIYAFKDLNSWNSIKTLYNIQDEDFEFVNGILKGTDGLNFELGGSNLIKQSDLPNIEWSFQVRNAYLARYNEFNIFTTGSSGSAERQTSNGGLRTASTPEAAGNAGALLKLKLNGNVSQTELDIQHQKIVYVLFKKNITKLGLSKKPSDVLFWKGQVFNFDTQVEANEFIGLNNLQDGIDYNLTTKTLLNDLSGNLSVDNDSAKSNLFSPNWYNNAGSLGRLGSISGGQVEGSFAYPNNTGVIEQKYISLVADLSQATKETTNIYIVKILKNIIKE